MTVTVFRVTERSEVALPSSDFFKDGALDIDPAIGRQGYFDIRLHGNQIRLIAGHYIGIVPINSSLTLRIEPKVPIASIVGILSGARETPEVIEKVQRTYTHDQGLDVLSLLVEALSNALVVLEEYGIPKDYSRQVNDVHGVRGKIRIGPTVTRNWAKGAYDVTNSEYFSFDRDSIINRSILYTIWHVSRVLNNSVIALSASTATRISRAIDWFPTVGLDRRRSFLPSLKNLLVGGNLSTARTHLKPLLQLCYMLLSDLGIDLESEAQEGVDLPALVINLEHAFQQFIIFGVQQRVRSAEGYACWNTTSEHKHAMFTSASPLVPSFVADVFNPKATADPDFVIVHDGEPSIVCDVKYKEETERSDIYQAVAHSAAYGASDCMLVYPGGTVASCECLGNVGNVRVFIYKFPLGDDSLAKSLEDLTRACEAIAASSSIS